MEAKICSKFITEDIARQVGEHTEKWFVWLRQKQGRDAHLERKGVGVPNNEGESERRSVLSYSLRPMTAHGIL